MVVDKSVDEVPSMETLTSINYETAFVSTQKCIRSFPK